MNLLKETTIRNKILTLVETVPTDLWLDIAWERLCELVGYDLSEGAKVEIFEGGIDNRKLYLSKRPLTTITSVKINNVVLENTNYSNYNGIAVRFNQVIPQNTRQPFGMSGICNSNEIIVDYIAGYTAETFPNTLLLVASDLLETLQSSIGEEGNLSAYRINDISYTWKSQAEITGKFNDILNQFRAI